MRPLEILLLLPNLVFLILQFIPGLRSARWAAFLPVAAAVIALLHLLLERPRWQMVPLYGITALFAALALFALLRGSSFAWAAGWAVTGLLGILLAALLPALVPVPNLPDPGGPYAIGTQVFEWTDPDRTEIYPPTAGSPRRIIVQVWYPAELVSGAQREPYLRDIEKLYPAIASENGSPAFMFSHLPLARTHAVTNAPAAAGLARFPVLVFSHGWRGLRVQNTFQMEELASRGYVIFSADHTYGASGVAFSDGTLLLKYDDALPDNVPDEAYDRAARLLGQTWVGDIRFTLDQAARINSGDIESPLARRLDLQRVGIFGHSTGGGAAVEACYLDARCTAGLSMDAWLIPYSREMVTSGLEQPFLFMQSEHWQARRNTPLVESLFASMKNDAYRLVIDDTYHDTFADIALFMPLIDRIRTRSLFGVSPQERINAYTIAFFDRYLKDEPAALLDESAQPLEGVRIERQKR